MLKDTNSWRIMEKNKENVDEGEGERQKKMTELLGNGCTIHMSSLLRLMKKME